jgi:hypothetical protein
MDRSSIFFFSPLSRTSTGSEVMIGIRQSLVSLGSWLTMGRTYSGRKTSLYTRFMHPFNTHTRTGRKLLVQLISTVRRFDMPPCGSSVAHPPHGARTTYDAGSRCKILSDGFEHPVKFRRAASKDTFKVSPSGHERGTPDRGWKSPLVAFKCRLSSFSRPVLCRWTATFLGTRTNV